MKKQKILNRILIMLLFILLKANFCDLQSFKKSFKLRLERGENTINQIILVGRLTKDPELQSLDGGKKVARINVAVTRPFKNSDGLYETDFIRCTLWNNIAINTFEYCKTGDVVGIKGRLQTNNYEKEDGTKVYSLEVIAEKITFITSKDIENQTVSE